MPNDAPDLSIPADKLCFIIAKAREFDVKDVVTDPDDASNPTDDAMVAVLEDHRDDPVVQELVAVIHAMSEDEQVDLVTLTWLGRGDGSIEDGASCAPKRRAPITGAPLHIFWDPCWLITSRKEHRSSASPAPRRRNDGRRPAADHGAWLARSPVSLSLPRARLDATLNAVRDGRAPLNARPCTASTRSGSMISFVGLQADLKRSRLLSHRPYRRRRAVSGPWPCSANAISRQISGFRAIGDRYEG